MPKSPKQTKASLAADKPGKAVAVQQINNTDYEETQCNELEVIKSMFPDEYEQIEKAGAWKKSAIAFRLHLKAASNKNFAATISVEFTATYPKSAPFTNLEDVKGLSTEKKNVLSKKIKDVIEENLGMEMVWMIATTIQEYLDEQAETREADDKKPNLLDEMALKAEAEKKALEEKVERQRKKEEQKRLEAERKEEEAYAKQARQRVEQEKELKEKAKPKVGFIDDELNDTEGDAIKFDRKITIKHDGETYSFNKVAGMVRLGRGPLTTIYSVRPLLPNGRENTMSFALKQVDIFDPHPDCGEGKRHLVDLEADLDKLRCFTHSSVIQLYDSSIEELPPHKNSNSKGWRISILMELSSKGSLGGLLQTVNTISTDMARTWVVQLLEGLDAIHKEGLVHRAVHVNNVLLFTPSSSSKTILKLSDVGLAHRLWLIKYHKKDSQTPMTHSKSAFWLPPEQANSQAMTKKADVWNLGIVIVQMFFGLDVIEKYRSPKDLMDELGLSEIMMDFLAKIFRQDPKKRSTPFELLPSEFLRSNTSIWANDSPMQSPSQDQNSLTLPTPRKRRESNIMLDRPGSRYDSEFTEGSRLGKGGFGEVVKARHKIDGRVYAIKKVHQAGMGSLDQVLSEVMLLSRISHQYVVRYYGAWIEEDRANMVFNNSSESEYSIRSLDPDTKSNLRGNASRGLDFISSTGFEIEFGYDDDDDEPDDDSDDDEDCDEAEESSSTDEEDRAVISYEISEVITEGEDEDSESEDNDRTSSLRVVEDHLSTSPRAQKLTKIASRESKRLGATLYIQMEYCEKQTLRDLIHQDLQSNVDGCWLLLRQILEGLAYLHNMGIIHRDLKPDNIFLDENNHPKIGDFGLATMGQKELLPQTVAPDADQDMTREVGTALYVAPELSASSLGSYTSKVDMYSLGIIYFEMCVAFSTSMERGQVIHSIREANFKLPPEFPVEKRPTEATIVKSLLAHTPDERPSAQELLTSGVIPFKVEDESMRQILHSLIEPSSVHYQNVLRTLFGRPAVPPSEPFYDASLKAQQMATSDVLLQMQVKEKLVSIFRNHGAVEATRPFLVPVNEYYAKSEAVRLLDESGMVVNMPYDLTLPHARQLARCPPPYTKSFCFGTVFRDNLPLGGQPRSHGEVVFDIVSSSSRDLAIKEAEVIKVLDEIIDAFPQFKSVPMCYHINHADLLDLIMEFCRIKPEESTDVKNILSTLNQGETTWNAIRQELRSPPISLSSTSLDDLQKFDWRETDLDKAMKRIDTIFSGAAETSTSSSIFTHIKAVVKNLVGYEVKRNVYINPLATFNDKFYKGGLMFQCVNDSKRRTVFAAGGRYDNLIRACRTRMPNQPELVHAVGFNLASDSLYKSMMQYNKKSSKKPPTKGQNEYSGVWARRRCDVLVASLDLEILRSQGMNLVAELWANNIKAELATEATEHLHRQDGDDSYGWMVIIKPSAPTPTPGEMNLRVKNLIKNKDKDMYSKDLVMHLQLEIGERNKGEVHAERHRIQRQISNQETSNAKTKEYDDLAGMTILQPVKGGKKVRRPNVLSATQRKAAELSESFEDCPVVAVELKDETLDLIRATQLQGPESWKKLIQSTSPAERKYLGEIKDVLDEMSAKKKWKNAFLYNIRTDVLCFYYLY